MKEVLQLSLFVYMTKLPFNLQPSISKCLVEDFFQVLRNLRLPSSNYYVCTNILKTNYILIKFITSFIEWFFIDIDGFKFSKNNSKDSNQIISCFRLNQLNLAIKKCLKNRE